MKLHKRLSINNNYYSLVDHTITLDLFAPGRAVFTVEADSALSGLVIFECAYTINTLERWFIGYVESSTTLNPHHQRVFCRELSAVLYKALPLALRDVDMSTVLAAITTHTHLTFELPTNTTLYTRTQTATFYCLANGYFAMDQLARVFNYQKPIWQQQVSGSVFVGSWDDSPWANKPVNISNTLESNVANANSATIPAIPKLRPGVLYNNVIITSIDFTASTMRLTWSNNPWAER